MTMMNNHSLFVTCLSSTHKLISKHVPLRTFFENSYREHLCNFNFEQYLATNCTISLSKQVEALKNACIDTRSHINALIEQGIDASLNESYITIYHQIWTPILSATLAQMVKTSAAGSAKTNSKKTTSAAEIQILPNLPTESVDEVCTNLWNLSLSGEILFPKLCTRKFCASCVELLFDLPLSKCSVDCVHKKISKLGVYPHLGRKFQDKLKPHHCTAPVKVKNVYKPHTYKNPMYECQPPSELGPSVKELAQGVDMLEINSNATTSTPSVISESRSDGVLRDTPMLDHSWAEEVEQEEVAPVSGEQQTPELPRPVLLSPRKRKPSLTDLAEGNRKKATTPPKQLPRRSPRNARN